MICSSTSDLDVNSRTVPSGAVTVTWVVDPPRIFPSINLMFRKSRLIPSSLFIPRRCTAILILPADSFAIANSVLYSMLRDSASCLHSLRRS